MYMYAVLSDIHGNMFALEKVAEDMKSYDISGVILLGDLIDYGMESNEVLDYIQTNFDDMVICSIWGNHEKSILTSDFEGFSSKRGVESAKYTSLVLKRESIEYIKNNSACEGFQELEVSNCKILAIHGSLDDYYWKSILPDNVRGDYSMYDVVLSGHSHKSHMFFKSYEIYDPIMRNRHITYFINPGSVGQPRNHNPAAQYAIVDFETMSVNLRAVKYDVESAMALYDGSVDDFYKKRLEYGV